jgi:hypothetical protein
MKDLIDFFAHPSHAGILALVVLGIWYVFKLAIDFYKSNVLPRVYERSLTRRALALPTAAKVLDSDWQSAAYFRDGNPKLIDFKDGRIFPRPELSDARGILQKGRFLRIQGPPSSGKTVIALNLAYEFSRAKRPVLYFSRPSLLDDPMFEFFASPESKRELDRRSALVILDDVHLDPARAARLFSLIYANYTKLTLIFVSRPLHAAATAVESMGTFDFPHYMQALAITAETSIAALANYYSERKFGYPIPPVVLKTLQEECGTDLLLLGRYLREWEGGAFVHLPDIRRSVFQTVKNELERLRAKSPDSVAALLIISLFYRYEIQVERQFLESTLGLNAELLVATGDVREQNSFLLLHHSSMAKLYANVFKTLNLPEFARLRADFSPLPEALFAAYLRTVPRNACETLVAVRKIGVIAFCLRDATLHASLRRAIENERDLNILGWSMLCLHSADRKLAWNVLRDAGMSGAATEALPASPEDIRLFLFNSIRVSRVKGVEWLNLVPRERLVEAIHGLSLKHAAETMQFIYDFSPEYFNALLPAISPARICEQVLHEDDIEALKEGLAILGNLCGNRVCIRAYVSLDGFGESVTRLSFYFDTKRVVRFLKRDTGGMPFGTSVGHKLAYLSRLFLRGESAGAICIDDGACAALERRRSLFPVGVKSVIGHFDSDAIVDIVNLKGERIGVGVSNFSSEELKRVAGLRSDQIKAVTGMVANRVMDNDLIVAGRRLAALH